jgi:proteasome lid subunit RPN8/RPN11
VTLADGVELAIIEHARDEAPRECCGLLIGRGDHVVEAVRSANIAERGITRYQIDPRDHLKAIRSARQRGLHVIGAYHSHPRARALPSRTDAAEAFTDFFFVIAGLAVDPPELTAWTWADGNFAPVPLVRS